MLLNLPEKLSCMSSPLFGGAATDDLQFWGIPFHSKFPALRPGTGRGQRLATVRRKFQRAACKMEGEQHFFLVLCRGGSVGSHNTGQRAGIAAAAKRYVYNFAQEDHSAGVGQPSRTG